MKSYSGRSASIACVKGGHASHTSHKGLSTPPCGTKHVCCTRHARAMHADCSGVMPGEGVGLTRKPCHRRPLRGDLRRSSNNGCVTLNAHERLNSLPHSRPWSSACARKRLGEARHLHGVCGGGGGGWPPNRLSPGPWRCMPTAAPVIPLCMQHGASTSTLAGPSPVVSRTKHGAWCAPLRRFPMWVIIPAAAWSYPVMRLASCRPRCGAPASAVPAKAAPYPWPPACPPPLAARLPPAPAPTCAPALLHLGAVCHVTIAPPSASLNAHVAVAVPLAVTSAPGGASVPQRRPLESGTEL